MLQTLFNSCLFYGGVLLLPYSPGELAWKLFRNRRGRVSLFHRDLICDTETLMSLPKAERSLDECTTAFAPFIPLLTLNDEAWKERRKIMADGLRSMHIKPFNWTIPSKQGDVYWDIFEQFFLIGFQLIFGRHPKESEYAAMYPGIKDMNRIIKRQVAKNDMVLRWKLYNQVVLLIKEQNDAFIFAGHEAFTTLRELDQVSLLVEDMLTSICIQCTDLVCHLLLLYIEHPDAFKANLAHAIDETLRLYPLTDIWTRKGKGGWIASLVQLNRSGWVEPDKFLPGRWESGAHHPPLISWGYDSRSCPATKIGYSLAKGLFEHIISEDGLWMIPAANFSHERTFIHGCQLWVGRGAKPETSWRFSGKYRTSLKAWIYSRLRIIDQCELW